MLDSANVDDLEGKTDTEDIFRAYSHGQDVALRCPGCAGPAGGLRGDGASELGLGPAKRAVTKRALAK